MLKQELLNYAVELQKESREITRMVENFTSAGFDWDNVTETQLAIFQELYPLRNFEPSLDVRQEATIREGEK